MSEQDRFDWNDDMDFDSEADVQEEYGDFEDPLDGFSDFENISDFEDAPDDGETPAEDAGEIVDMDESGETEVVMEGLDEKIPADEKGTATLNMRKRKRGISAVGLGFLFTASILVAGVGIGGAILLAEGVHPAGLWQPQNLRQIDQLLNFADHPLNILYMVTMGIVFLALLGSYKMSKAAVEANSRTRDAEEMLDRLTALNLDNEEEWQSQEFKEYPPAEAFVIRVLGGWRLQEARQQRLTGVEGEIHRLEKALKTNTRSDLTGRFDYPAVGRLADEMVRYFDARDAAAGKLEEYENKDHGNSKEIIAILHESRQWNGATLDNLGVHCSALDELTSQMENLGHHLKKASNEAKSTEDMTDIIEGIRKDIAKLSSGGAGADKMASELSDLVDKGSKLAFKIAMEVARLGPRGERLLPMSQSLEDLTTGFRQLADKANNRDTGTAPVGAQKRVNKKLETLAALITEDDQAAWRDMADEVQDFGPAAARISGDLTRMGDGFNKQDERLVNLGTSFADMTGAEFDSSSIPRKESSKASVPTMVITDRKSTSKPVESAPVPEVIDPFAAAGPLILPNKEGPEDPDFSSSVLPGRDISSFESATVPDSPADMPLSGDEEKVYDLEDFGASPAPEPESEDTEEVYELSSFGATPMVDDENQGPATGQVPESGEEIHDLAEFGASPLDGQAPESGEEVYDLAEFDASPLDRAVGSDEEGATVEDEVFDLADFGAKPMK